MPAEQLVNLDFLKNFTGGNPEKMARYIGLFLQAYPVQMEKMKKALMENDFDSLRATAHSLKPQITYMGIKRGDEMIKTIEHRAGDKVETETLPALVGAFDSTCLAAIEELKKYI